MDHLSETQFNELIDELDNKFADLMLKYQINLQGLSGIVLARLLLASEMTGNEKMFYRLLDVVREQDYENIGTQTEQKHTLQ